LVIHVYLQYLAELFLEGEMFQAESLQHVETHFVSNNIFFRNRAV